MNDELPGLAHITRAAQLTINNSYALTSCRKAVIIMHPTEPQLDLEGETDEH
ncbi:MAG: hypothetical protein ACJ74G_07820 [Blastocatellia bacterium]